MRWTGLPALAAIALANAGPLAAQDAARGEEAFRKCRACHAVGPGATNKVGPQLNGIVGRKAAAAQGFNYSDAMRNAAAEGLAWTEDKLSAYLESPVTFIPKNKMAYGGVKDATERADLIAYLKTLQ